MFSTTNLTKLKGAELDITTYSVDKVTRNLLLYFYIIFIIWLDCLSSTETGAIFKPLRLDVSFFSLREKSEQETKMLGIYVKNEKSLNRDFKALRR